MDISDIYKFQFKWERIKICTLYLSQSSHLIPVQDYPSMKYTAATLQKHEKVLEEAGYIIRYEKGTFQSGYCLLEERKVVVLNKFLNVEGRIHTLTELIPVLKMDPDQLSPESGKLYKELRKNMAPQES